MIRTARVKAPEGAVNKTKQSEVQKKYDKEKRKHKCQESWKVNRTWLSFSESLDLMSYVLHEVDALVLSGLIGS